MSFFDDLAQFFGQMAGDIIEDTFGEAFSKKLEAIQMAWLEEYQDSH